MSEFLDKELQVQAANETAIQFDGVVLLDYKLSDEDEGFVVPLLVSSDKIVDPILGYNVIEYLGGFRGATESIENVIGTSEEWN